MGFLGFGGSSHDSVQQERAEQRGQRAWEELQETTEEVQEAVQEKLGHAKHKADQQAQSVKGQMGHLRGRAPGAAEQGEQLGRVQAEEVSEKVVNAKERVKGKAESSANAVAERASSTADQIKGKAWDVKESAKEKARRAEETAEDQAQDTKQGLKSKWWEKKEKAGKAADETSWKTRSNIRSAEQTAAEKAEEAKRAVAEKAEQAKEAAQHGAQRVRSNMQTVAEIGKEKAGEAKEKVVGKGQQLKSGARDKVGELEEDAESVKEAAKRKAEDAKRSAAKPVWWLGRKADQGADKAAEGAGKAEGVVQGSAQEVREAAAKAGRWVGDKAEQATDRAAQGVGYTAGYAEGTAQEVVHGAQEAVRKVRDTAGDDLRVPVKRVETPFLSIRSKTVKELLAGGLAGAIAQTSATPLEVVRTKLLGGRHGQNVGQVVKHLNRKSGKDWPVKQTSGSFGVNVLRVAIQKGVELATYEKVKAKLKRRGHPGDRQIPGLDKLPRQVPESTWAGAAAGVASTLATYPFEALKDRVLIMPEKYSGFGDAFKQVLFHEGGLPALYRGVVPAVLGIVPQSAVNFYTYDKLKEDYRRRTGRKHVPALYTLAFGATAGAVSQLATYPLEVARKQVSVSVLPAVETGKAANAAYANVVEAVRGILREEGVAGLYKGAGAQVAQIIPVAGLSWVVFEAAKRALQAEDEDED